jgi:X-X-X-Leu-X-X-Gly heptad repeat protein
MAGPRIELGAFGARAGAAARRRAFALPVAAGLVLLALMIPLAAPVLSLGSGPPDAKLLPPSSKARQDYEAVARVMGPGWVSPFEVVVTRRGAPVTTRAFLASLAKFEKQTSQMKGVSSVLGPGALLTNANELQGVPKGLNAAAATAKKSKKDLRKLIAGLKLATDGVAQLRGGLGQAATGAGQLHGGTGQAYGGSGQLASGLDQASGGAQQLKAGAAQAASGAHQLADGLGLAKEGVAGGLPAIQKLIDAVSANAKEVNALAPTAAATKNQVAAASAALAAMTVGRDDPNYAAVVASLEQAAGSNATLGSAIATAGRNASLNAITVAVVKQQVVDLQTGIGKLLTGANQLSAGLHTLSGGNAQLASGIAQLDAGGAKLQDGLRQLNVGAGQLAAGLGSGIGPSGELLTGMHTITGSVVKARSSIPSTKDLEKLRKEAPGLFDSGYFVLAAIDGAPPAARDAAAFVVNVDQGGYAGRITVVPDRPARTAATRALHDRLSTRVAMFARANHAQAAVGGTGADLIDYRNLGLERLPVVLLALVALTFIVLLIVTRSFATSALAVLLNVITVGAVFGVLSFLFGGTSPRLGGPGFVDPVTIIAILTIVLALSIDYEVFAVERLRSVTGAGIAMLVVLLPFAPSDVTLVREFAIGMALAVVIDTAVVRPLLAALTRDRAEPRRRLRLHTPRPIPH